MVIGKDQLKIRLKNQTSFRNFIGILGEEWGFIILKYFDGTYFSEPRIGFLVYFTSLDVNEFKFS